MKNVKSFGEFINESTDLLNEMAYRSEFASTNRSSAEIEKELIEMIDKHDNQSKYENEARVTYLKDKETQLTPIANKYLPAGTQINRDGKFSGNDYLNIYLKGGNDEVCSIYLPVGGYKVDSFDAMLKASYINFASFWVYLDSDSAERVKALGKVVETLGTKKSPFYKEWYDKVTEIETAYRTKMDELQGDGSKWSYAKRGNELRKEYINAKFQEILKPGLVIITDGFEVNKDKRGRFGDKVTKIVVDKLKPKNADVTYTYTNWSGIATEVKATWQVATLFEAWSQYSKEGQEIDKKYASLSSW